MSHLRLTEEQYAALGLKRGQNAAAGDADQIGANEITETSHSRSAAPRKPSEIEEQMAEQIWLCKLPEPVRQFQPFPQRKWKIDFAWPRYKLALEVDGAVHRIKSVFKSSFERGYWLMRADWRVLHVGGDQVRSGEAVTWIEQLLQAAQDREEARRHR
jgi:very-short-patch-repair endonuclease